MKQITKTASQIRVQRLSLNMTQSEFWNAVGVTQSAGARYEGGRKIPRPTMLCILAKYFGVPIPAHRGTAKRPPTISPERAERLRGMKLNRIGRF